MPKTHLHVTHCVSLYVRISPKYLKNYKTHKDTYLLRDDQQTQQMRIRKVLQIRVMLKEFENKRDLDV